MHMPDVDLKDKDRELLSFSHRRTVRLPTGRAKNSLEHGENVDDAIKYHQQAYESHKSVVKQLKTSMIMLSHEKQFVQQLQKCEELNKHAAIAHYWAATNLQNRRGDNDIDWRPSESMPEDFYAA